MDRTGLMEAWDGGSRYALRPGWRPPAGHAPAARSVEFELDRTEALEGVAEQIQTLLAQDARNPATLERLEVCFSLMRHLVGPRPVGC